MFWPSLACGLILFWLVVSYQLPNHRDEWVDEHHGNGSIADEWGLDSLHEALQPVKNSVVQPLLVQLSPPKPGRRRRLL
jgi:hypothetical protein